MLVLTRKLEESVVVVDTRTGDTVLELKVVSATKTKVRLAFDAPQHVHILRKELVDEKYFAGSNTQ